MRQLKLLRWAAALTLAIALAPGAASAQEVGTITISSTFTMDWLPDGTISGEEHTWTLTLYGTTQTHHRPGYSTYLTEIHATSFDFEFSGPDAATLNSIVSEHIAGGDVLLRLWNSYGGGGGGTWELWVGGDVWFWTCELSNGWNTLFPSDADGYPVVGPDPITVWAEGHFLNNDGSGNNGLFELGGASLVTFEGSVGGPEPVVLAAEDVSILEGNHGFSTVAVVVTLTNASSQAITVQYQTVNGTAVAPQDYTAKSGTLTFQPGQTSRTISVKIKGDLKLEPDETFSVRLSNAAGATIAVATVTILNDD
jgi:hypothetical protein